MLIFWLVFRRIEFVVGGFEIDSPENYFDLKLKFQ